VIGYLTTEYPGITQNYGGIGTSIKDLSSCLIDRRLNPVIILVNDDNDSVQISEGVSIVKIKRIRFPGLTAFLTGFKVSKVVNELVRQGKMEVLEVPDWTGLSAFVKVSCPIVMRLNGSETYFKFLEGKAAKFRYRFLEQRAFKKTDYLISVSRYTADVTNQIFNSNRIMEIIPNAVDSDLFVPSEIIATQQTVLYFGTLTRKKGVFELPAIFGIVHKNNPDVKILLIGRDNPDTHTGSESTWMQLQKQFETFGVSNVQYIPALPRHELISYIQRASVCVFPSYAEALPVSWLEAMSCGKAVVASNIGWASEIIADSQNGFLVHPADHTGFAGKINLLLSDSELRTRIGVAAMHNNASCFTTKVIIDHYLKFYSKILGKSIAAYGI
jgi:glycosyltransferase involved in cell wall biosynthesis